MRMQLDHTLKWNSISTHNAVIDQTRKFWIAYSSLLYWYLLIYKFYP